MPNQIGYEQSAHMFNPHLLFNIGHFNDKTREIIKGATFDMKQKGYALGSLAHIYDLKNIVQGSTLNKYLFRYPTQSINYVECHDNNTFFDKAKAALPQASITEIKKRQRLATSMVILLQGVPFIHAGQEFYRTKKGVENSYKSSDDINKLDWNLLDENMQDVEYVRELIRIRRKYDLLRLTTKSKVRDYTSVKVTDHGSIEYRLKDEETDLIVIFKNSSELEVFDFEHRYQLIFDGKTRSRRVLSSLEVDDITTYILKRK